MSETRKGGVVSDLRAPFPYFGGKSRAAALVWERFGTPINYVEPFFGSGAVLLACPEQQRPRVETVNDANAHLANVWRAISLYPEEVARAADWPVIEVDLHARHKHLLARIPEMRTALDADPKWCDPELAGWWIWGASAWIGSGWCEEGSTPSLKAPILIGGNAGASPQLGKGVHGGPMRQYSRRLPDLGGGTQWGTDEPNHRAGRGVHAEGARGPSRQLPFLGNGGSQDNPQAHYGRGINTDGNRSRLYDIFHALGERFRYTRVTCGDWSRICTPAVTYRHGLTAVFLDPPYDGYEHLYSAAEEHEESLSARVRKWALEMGERPDMRIALCGYEGEHDMPATWECVAWKAKGGYSNAAKEGNNGNSKRERIWFSPACLRPGVTTGQIMLFGSERSQELQHE